MAGLAGSARAISTAKLDDRIQYLTYEFEKMQQDPSHRVPADELAKAKGVILLDRSKGGFIFGYQSGGGVMLAKDDAGHWSAPAFVSSKTASLGFQIGGERDFLVILVMSQNVLDALTRNNVEFGAQASGTDVILNSNQESSTAPSNSMLVYGEHHGLYGGAVIKGGSISPDNKANAVYYGKDISTTDILFDNKVQPTPNETDLIKDLAQPAK